ncbi:hypothetical protein [Marinoscillum sp. MHG1-6]|uniref:hypothetical protein n=1 Tax=Marinoscillum sp. MHG1-6 TaxID=2959627 RepID=UPI002158826A|nr:hypothetical protein [Marinoscillum sp. MHG1-6]
MDNLTIINGQDSTLASIRKAILELQDEEKFEYESKYESIAGTFNREKRKILIK